MADTDLGETLATNASPTRKPLEDFDPELSAIFNEAFLDSGELEDLLYRRAEKGFPL